MGNELFEKTVEILDENGFNEDLARPMLKKGLADIGSTEDTATLDAIEEVLKGHVLEAMESFMEKGTARRSVLKVLSRVRLIYYPH